MIRNTHYKTDFFQCYYNIARLSKIVAHATELQCVACSPSQPLPFSEEHDFFQDCTMGISPDLVVFKDLNSSVREPDTSRGRGGGG